MSSLDFKDDKIGIYITHHGGEGFPFFDGGIIHSILNGPENPQITYPIHLHDTSGNALDQKLFYTYGELTTVWWIWKNTNHQIYGFEQYNSYLALSLPNGNDAKDPNCTKPIENFNAGTSFQERLGLTEENLKKFIKIEKDSESGPIDIVTSKSEFGGISFYGDFIQKYHFSKELFDTASDILDEDAYKKDGYSKNDFLGFSKKDGNEHLYCNSEFICNKKFFDQKNEFIFPIITKLYDQYGEAIQNLADKNGFQLLDKFSKILTSYFIFKNCVTSNKFAFNVVDLSSFSIIGDMLEVFYPTKKFKNSQLVKYTPLFRLYNTPFADHVYSTNLKEINDLVNNKNYRYEQFMGYVLNGPGNNNYIKISRLYSENHHDSVLVKSETDINDLISQGYLLLDAPLGYAQRKNGSKTKAAYSHPIEYTSAPESVKFDHFITLNKNEPIPGEGMNVTDDGIMFYVDTLDSPEI